MAANPFDAFDAPPAAPKANPFDAFDTPSASSSAAQPVAPSSAGPSQSWSDYLLDHLHSFSQGLNAATRVATDAPTFGLMDKVFGQQAQADTAGAYKQMGGWSIPLSLAGSLATGGPELKAASAIGEVAAPYVGKWAGGVLGSGAVGAGTAAAGAYGHEQGWTPDAGDIGKAAAIGGALGAAGGTLGGVTGVGAKLPAAPTEQDLRDAATQAYAPLSNILFDGKSEVHPALDAAENAIAQTDLTGMQRKAAPSTMAIVNNLRAKPQLTAADIQSAQKQLGKISGSIRASDQDTWMAPKFNSALQDVLENGIPQTGVPAGAQPIGYAASVKADGDALHGKAEDIARLNDWIAKSQVTGGPDVGNQARSYLTSKEGQTFAPPGSPQYSALDTLAGTSGGPDVSMGPSLWDVRHMAHPLVGGAIGAAFGGYEHHDPSTIAEETLAGLALGYGLHKGVPAIQGALARAGQNRAINAAGVALGTGQETAALDPVARLRMLSRGLIYGQGGRGLY